MQLYLQALFFLIALGSLSHAHEGRPLYIEIHEQENDHFLLQWKTPTSFPDGNSPSVRIEGCAANTEVSVMRAGEGEVRRQQIHCPDNISRLLISYRRFNPGISTLVRLDRLGGETFTKLLSPMEDEWQIPVKESALGTAVEYIELGARHIGNGFDHLLFVACLIFIAGADRRVITMVTGFTVGHSFTLILSSLRIISLPTAPVEALIALSIVFLAAEISKGWRNTMTWQHPIAVSSCFGLLHGLGFAAALNEIGLPKTDLIVGLLFFNLGVELGQIVFVIGVMIVCKIMEHLEFTIRAPLFERVTAYVIGSLASYWVIERGFGFIIA